MSTLIATIKDWVKYTHEDLETLGWGFAQQLIRTTNLILYFGSYIKPTGYEVWVFPGAGGWIFVTLEQSCIPLLLLSMLS